MRLIKPIALSAIIALSACQRDVESTTVTNTENVADITLNATSDIRTPSPIIAASFVPNSVATWLGHIILIDEKGTLHRATTDSAETNVVALGKYVDVIGLSREKKSGAFLALTPQGQIKAFVQTYDEGNFGPIAVSQDNNSFERFCVATEPSGTRIWAKTKSGPKVFFVEIFEDTSLSINEVDPKGDEMNLCENDSALSLGSNHKLKPDNNSPHLTISDGQKDISVKITNGLSIGGIKTTGFVTVTNVNMGSVFNEGLILVAEKDEGRLVLISLAYALNELDER